MLSQKYRFHGYGSLRYVLKHGDSYRSALYTVRYSRNPHRKHPRFAIVVSKKVAKRAVERNAVRRKLYEALRKHLNDIAPYDVVIIVHSTEVLDWSGEQQAEVCDTIRQHCNLEQLSKN